MLTQEKNIRRAYADALHVYDVGTPSQFAARYRWLKPGTTERPGRWTNEHFAYLVQIMAVEEEAIESGKRRVVLMKSGQVGGSEAMINVVAWLKAKYEGPILYLISKDELAEEFGRERFSYILDTCEPLKRKALRGKANGETLRHKRFVDGKLDLSGGRSVLNLQSQPYRFVVIDEVDSLLDEIKNQGDPIKIAEIRLDAFEGDTLMIAFAHPTTDTRGAAKLYYQLSDQRRGMVSCVHCDEELWLQWEHVQPVPIGGMTQQQAERTPECWTYFCPHCGANITDAERWRMVRDVRQKSVLTPEEAERKTWIGVHFSQLYMPNKTIRMLAEEYIPALDNESSMIVFVNKRLGDRYEPKVQDITPDNWRRLVWIPRGEDDREAWRRGEVPYGVRFLTAGQDSRSTELHWSVWGWGVRLGTDGLRVLVGRVIDWGVVERPYSLELDARELNVFDQLIYRRLWPASWDHDRTFQVRQGGHDIGWNQIAINEYCRLHPYRAIPVKGAAETVTSRSLSPPVRAGVPLSYIVGSQRISDDRVRPLLLNTYLLKLQLYGMLEKTVEVADDAGPRKLPLLALPADALGGADGERFIVESSNESLVPSGNRKKEERVWKRKGPNHFADCNVYAYACALNLDPFQGRLTFAEAEERKRKTASRYGVVGKAWV